MANVIDMLDELQNRALKEPELKERLKNTKKEKEPLSAFCRVCQELGYEIYEMDLITEGRNFMQPCAEVPMAVERIRLSWREKMIFMNYFSQAWSKKAESML